MAIKGMGHGGCVVVLSALVAGLAGTALVGPARAADRTWIGGNADWDGNAFNWTGFDEPDADDVAIFNTPNSVDMVIDNTIMGLTMSGGIDLFTVDQALDVNGNITLSDASTNLWVGTNNTAGVPFNALDAEDITINNGATFRLGGTQLDTIAVSGEAVLNINVGGTFLGNGTVRNADATGVQNIFNNNGTLRVSNVLTGFVIIGGTPDAQTLTFEAADADARFNLDGTLEGGVVDITRNQTLVIDVPLADTFNGTIDLSHNSTLQMTSAWSLGAGGLLRAENGFVPGQAVPIFIPAIPADNAFVNGSLLTMTGGTIEQVDGDGTLTFNAQLTTTGGTILNDGLMVFNNTTTIGAGTNFAMPTGTSSLEINATVNVDDADFNWDGSGNTLTNVVTINDFGNLDLDLASWDGNDSFEGQININGGELDVIVADGEWQVGGGADMNIGGSTTSFVNGSRVQFNGELNVNNTGTSLLDFNAASEFASGSRLDVANDGFASMDGAQTFFNGSNISVVGTGVLELDGDTTWFNGTFTGTGTIRQDGSATYAGQTTIGVDTYDWDGVGGDLTHTMNSGSSLTLNVDAIGTSAGDGFSDTLNMNSSTLTVNTPGNWELEGRINTFDTGFGTPTIAGSTMDVSSGGLLDVNASTDINGGSVWREGSQLLVDSTAVVNLGGGTTLDGGDIVDNIDRSIENSIVNNNSPLTVTGTSTVNVEEFDWDQSTTTVQPGGDFSMLSATIESAGAQQQYDNVFTLNSGDATINLSTTTEWVMDGTLNLNNTDGTVPDLFGDRIQIGNDSGTLDADVNAGGTGVSNIEAPVTFNSDADVFVAAGAELLVNNAGTIFTPFGGIGVNGEFTGTGTLRVIGAQFDEITTFNMVGGTVGLDGSIASNNPLIFQLTAGDTDLNAQLNINAAAVDDFGFTAAIGNSQSEINIANSGALIVNLDNPNDSWTVLSNGIVTYNGDAVQGTIIGGSDLNFDGTLNVNGDGTLFARVDFGSTAVVNINDAPERLRLDGGTINDPNTIAGGIISGPGNLVAIAENALSGFGTISSNIDFEGNAEVIASGGVLDVNASILDVGTLRANGGTLNLDVNLLSSVTQNGISLNNGTLQGVGTVTLDVRNLRGNGTVNSAVVNNVSIRAQNGTLILDGPNLNLDGTGSEDGLIIAETGNLEIRDSNNDIPGESFNGVATVNANRTLFVNGTVLDFGTDGALNLNAGTYRTNVSNTFNGDLVVNGNSEIQTDGGSFIVFGAPMTAVLNNDLQIDGDLRITNGASVSGVGSLTVLNGSRTQLGNGSTVSTLVNNSGNLTIAGAAVGTATVQDYDQSATGVFELDVNGTNLNQFDRLAVSGTVFLEGEVDVDFGFTPTVGDMFPFMTFLARVGMFDSLDVAGLGAGQDAIVTYTGTAAILEIINALILEGDYNGDGFVGQGDLDLVLLNFGATMLPPGFVEGAIPGGGPFDGLIGQNELDGVLLNFGNGTPPVVAVPEPTTAAALAVLAGLLGRRRRPAHGG
ncbi:MAG: PEP-CTERM sorting domain-containing protein [Planctomycetota bacterium]